MIEQNVAFKAVLRIRQNQWQFAAATSFVVKLHIFFLQRTKPKMLDQLYSFNACVTSRILGLDATKPVFGVSDKARLKPVSSALETS